MSYTTMNFVVAALALLVGAAAGQECAVNCVDVKVNKEHTNKTHVPTKYEAYVFRWDPLFINRIIIRITFIFCHYPDKFRIIADNSEICNEFLKNLVIKYFLKGHYHPYPDNPDQYVTLSVIRIMNLADNVPPLIRIRRENYFIVARVARCQGAGIIMNHLLIARTAR